MCVYMYGIHIEHRILTDSDMQFLGNLVGIVDNLFRTTGPFQANYEMLETQYISDPWKLVANQ